MDKGMRSKLGGAQEAQKMRRLATPDEELEIDEETLELIAAMRGDLAAFATAHFPPFQYAKHLYPLVDALHKIESGEIDRLMIFMPPRHSKSLLTSQMFPAWYLGHHPDQYVIAACYGRELVLEFGTTVRNIVTSDLFKMTFPEAALKGKGAATHRFSLEEGGKYFATSIGGVCTGKGAHVFLIDDPYKTQEEAGSETYRKKVADWYQAVAYTRLQAGGKIIVLQTRWHERDLSGWLLEEHQHEGWHVISLPAIAEQDDYFDGECWRKEGEALWPEFLDLEKLSRVKQAIGSGVWEALYQQRPSAKEGAIWKREWWRELPHSEWPKEFDFVVQFWDTAFKVKKKSDRSACTTWGVKNRKFYLIDVMSGKWGFPDLVPRLETHYQLFNPNVVVIEDQSSGISVFQQIKRKGIIPIKAYQTDKAKEVRAEATSPQVQSGRVFLPAEAPWKQSFIDEMARFPNGAHDDIPDTVSMGLDFLTKWCSSILDLRTNVIAIPRTFSIYGR